LLTSQASTAAAAVVAVLACADAAAVVADMQSSTKLLDSGLIFWSGLLSSAFGGCFSCLAQVTGLVAQALPCTGTASSTTGMAGCTQKRLM
jgi:hypothetical protein